jgi:biopolymer transport protein ExbD
MKVKRANVEPVEMDMTPMIDMTFQLIAFFMILINFDASEQDESIQLPLSALAKPPESALESPITIQLTKDGKPVLAGQPYDTVTSIKPLLENERYVLQSQGRSEKDATIIIRAHRDAKTGIVQEVIKTCQTVGFEKFTLRAKEEVGY